MQCEVCGWQGKNLKSHMASSLTCPSSKRYQGGVQTKNDRPPTDQAESNTNKTINQAQDTPLPPSPSFEETAKGIVEQIISYTEKRLEERDKTLEERLKQEREHTLSFVTEQINQVGPSVAQYLRTEATKEQQAPASDGHQAVVSGGQDTLSKLAALAPILAQFMGRGTGTGLGDMVTQANQWGQALQAILIPLNQIQTNTRIETLRMIDLTQKYGPGRAAEEMEKALTPPSTTPPTGQAK